LSGESYKKRTSYRRTPQNNTFKMGFKDDWAHATPYLLFCVGVFACGDLIFGT
jgi:hypothetical protein